MPLTASSPIEPPGKRSGWTTKESVVSATSPPSSETIPASPSASSCSEPKAGSSSPSISPCVALPPAPCAIVTCASRNFARFARVVSMIPRIFCLALGDGAAHTTTFSRAKRPKL